MMLNEDLRVSYGKIAAVKDISINIAPGEIVTLIGPNRAGKSTLLDHCGVAAMQWRNSPVRRMPIHEPASSGRYAPSARAGNGGSINPDT